MKSPQCTQIQYSLSFISGALLFNHIWELHVIWSTRVRPWLSPGNVPPKPLGTTFARAHSEQLPPDRRIFLLKVSQKLSRHHELPTLYDPGGLGDPLHLMWVQCLSCARACQWLVVEVDKRVLTKIKIKIAYVQMRRCNLHGVGGFYKLAFGMGVYIPMYNPKLLSIARGKQGFLSQWIQCNALLLLLLSIVETTDISFDSCNYETSVFEHAEENCIAHRFWYGIISTHVHLRRFETWKNKQ